MTVRHTGHPSAVARDQLRGTALTRSTAFAAVLAAANGALVLAAVTVVLTSGGATTAAAPDLTARGGTRILVLTSHAASPAGRPVKGLSAAAAPPRRAVPARTSPATGPRPRTTAATAARPPAPAPVTTSRPTPRPVPTPTPTRAAPAGDAAYTARLLTLVNGARTDHGLPRLALSSCAQAFAQAQAASMARRGVMDHQPLGPVLSTCHATADGENVAYGNLSAEQIFAIWMGSPVHRANILSPRYTHLGNGATTRSDGRVYASQVFVHLG